jgi:shikimate dehydrogenase
MKKFGLIGLPLTHSFSKSFFTRKFLCDGLSGSVSYDNFPILSIAELPALILDEPDLLGLNVTIPYKEQVLQYVHQLSDGARAIGAVNVISIDRSTAIPFLKGYNTDAVGFEKSLAKLIKKEKVSALVLGTGGAAKAVCYVLQNRGIPFCQVSRSAQGNVISYQQIDAALIHSHRLIVNTTPLGMAPDTETLPQIPYGYLTAEHFLFDMIYNPEETAFLKAGRNRGCTVMNGLFMLEQQALASWDIWNDSTG